MQIYFAGSIRGGRSDKKLYEEIIQMLSSFGTVLTEHIGDQDLTDMGEEDTTEERIYNRDMQWLKSADFVVAEVSTPSLGVGYEIAQAENMGKKILCIYRRQPNKSLSAMIQGSHLCQHHTYESISELPTVFEAFLNS